jgi:hypothetical protein
MPSPPILDKSLARIDRRPHSYPASPPPLCEKVSEPDYHEAYLRWHAAVHAAQNESKTIRLQTSTHPPSPPLFSRFRTAGPQRAHLRWHSIHAALASWRHSSNSIRRASRLHRTSNAPVSSSFTSHAVHSAPERSLLIFVSPGQLARHLHQEACWRAFSRKTAEREGLPISRRSSSRWRAAH